ncbi:hypothetical protein [Sorangium sp. So ce1024]|uniref:hypothetical protein n=1 Tax=Sorangium sp. So ce1024 TaxID=3133327 RepID=UPI003EFC4439
MPRISDATLRAQIPTALLIGGDQALLERCQAAAMDVGIIVKACPVSMAAALAEERRPVAIVVTSSTYALSPEGFEDIARDVLSTLVRVDEALTGDELGAMLTTAARESRKQRSRQLTPGRYSLTPGAGDEGSSGPRSERWTIGVMTADARRDPEATPLPRSGPRSAGAEERAYRERVAAAVAAPRPADPAAPRSERLGVMAGFRAGPASPRPRRDPPATAGVVYARRDTPAPPSLRGASTARRDTSVPPPQPARAYVRRDTPLAGSQPAGGYPAREVPPAAPSARRATPAPITQRAGGYPAREAQAAVMNARREALAPPSWPAAPSSRPRAPSSRPRAPSSRPAAPSSQPSRSVGPAAPGSRPAAPGSWREAPDSWSAAPDSWSAAPGSRPAAPGSWPGAQGSRREAQAAAASPRREALAAPQAAQDAGWETAVPVSHDAAAHPWHEAAGAQPPELCAPPDAVASGAPGEGAGGHHPTPPPSSHRAPPSSRRAQFHVDIALLFDERGLPRPDPQEK